MSDLRNAIRRYVHLRAETVLEADAQGAIRRAEERSTTRAFRGWTAQGVAALALVGLVLGLTFVFQSSRHRSAPAATSGQVIALLANNRLSAFDGASASTIWERQLAPSPTVPPGRYVPTGHYIALSPDGSSVYALPLDEARGASRLAVVDSRSGQVRGSYSLAATGAIYGSLAVGPLSGRVYLFGQRPGATVVTVFDPVGGRVLNTWTARSMENWVAKGPVSGDFFIYQGMVSPDEKRLFYSYYGGRLDLAGTDWLDLTAGGLRRCVPPGPGAACLPGFAGFQLYQDGLLVIDPTNAQAGPIEQVDLSGRVKRHVDLQLGSGFIQDFALDAGTNRIYAVGSCGYLGGVSMVDLGTGLVSVLVPPDPPGVINKTIPCGQRVVLLSSSLLVAGRIHFSLADPAASGSLLMIDTATGKIVSRATTVSEPLDIVVFR